MDQGRVCAPALPDTRSRPVRISHARHHTALTIDLYVGRLNLAASNEAMCHAFRLCGPSYCMRWYVMSTALPLLISALQQFLMATRGTPPVRLLRGAQAHPAQSMRSIAARGVYTTCCSGALSPSSPP
jgi:hypothetical protein